MTITPILRPTAVPVLVLMIGGLNIEDVFRRSSTVFITTVLPMPEVTAETTANGSIQFMWRYDAVPMSVIDNYTLMSCGGSYPDKGECEVRICLPSSYVSLVLFAVSAFQ